MLARSTAFRLIEHGKLGREGRSQFAPPAYPAKLLARCSRLAGRVDCGWYINYWSWFAARPAGQQARTLVASWRCSRAHQLGIALSSAGTLAPTRAWSAIASSLACCTEAPPGQLLEGLCSTLEACPRANVRTVPGCSCALTSPPKAKGDYLLHPSFPLAFNRLPSPAGPHRVPLHCALIIAGRGCCSPRAAKTWSPIWARSLIPISSAWEPFSPLFCCCRRHLSTVPVDCKT